MPLDELLRTSDVVSIHVKLTDQTRGMIGPREIALMKRGALLVNTARGAIVDTPALVQALNNGHLGGAGIDVYDIEPLPLGSSAAGVRASRADAARRRSESGGDGDSQSRRRR